MNTSGRYIEWLLSVWAYWELRFLTGEAGWASTSSMVLALQAEIHLGSKVFGPKMPQFNEVAERMSRIINQDLSASHPDSAEALRAVYLHPDKRLQQLATERHISVRTLLQRTHEAKLFLEGYASTLYFDAG